VIVLCHEFGLDQPGFVWFVIWFGNVVCGDFGRLYSIGELVF